MKSVRRLALAAALLLSMVYGFGQAAPTSIFSNPQHAAADFLNAFRHSDWKAYTELSHPAAVKYYGGLRGFTDQMQRNRENSTPASSTTNLNIQQLTNAGSQWQCLLTGAGGINSEQRNTGILIGQSDDDGKSWTFIDLSLFPKASVPYIIPELIQGLVIPGINVNDPLTKQLVKGQ